MALTLPPEINKIIEKLIIYSMSALGRSLPVRNLKIAQSERLELG